ncbi:alpha/beta hydrolase fold protein [Thecamonas trahens ATCC 50062]|uniref:Alpha/beta hydrolase fold protein n=1 Tax=Thecamonas trahens ATCC 50062 TaxID=461836 RepID=A0A0L0DSU9_THETB|nr:alpha/beta hydrolase fold protein [Thecamonas trahens ATCC 50062]KNC55297.1 alpha/beta hydrolase fold protein [Thecamonas trahens ATCC 50062]|eukprot:XP_013753117.1 alpha/beta hydrolase fold protein [Thecamonas trahens ATCC 50062]
MHGLLGSSQNWRALTKALAKSAQRTVYAVDARNHGGSEWVGEMDYVRMAGDVEAFVAEVVAAEAGQDVAPVLIGHSMGGKVMMEAALGMGKEKVAGLVSVDMAPVAFDLEARSEVGSLRVCHAVQGGCPCGNLCARSGGPGLPHDEHYRLWLQG